ncbi:MAG: CehA/McbA family metallohydrolase, partial [Fibrobacteres bacterium]|nr:CehA/McbA family metallohydrolase [Fibrobacterota bacterium]
KGFLLQFASHYIVKMVLFPLLQVFSYIETHHRLNWLPSLLFRREPEIVFDAPHRLNPGLNLPAFMFIKDANRFPIHLKKITAAIGLLDVHRIFFLEFAPETESLNDKFYLQKFEIPLPDEYYGKVSLNFKLDYISDGKEKFALNDNIPYLQHTPYMVNISDSPLPLAEGWIAGDAHFHSSFTDDEVEYGAPVETVPLIGKAAGLSFAFLLDHSYDLDPRNPFTEPGSFERQHGDAAKATDAAFAVVKGEELSAINKAGKTVHAGLVNPSRFRQGYRDSGRIMSKEGDTLLSELETVEENELLFAAHPGFKPVLLEKLLLNRGGWSNQDIDSVRVIQLINGYTNAEFFRNRKLWIDALLRGRTVFVVAGNDAHGDYSKTRKIGVPLFTSNENMTHVFGVNRTLVPSAVNADSIIRAIKSGRGVVSNGPFLMLQAMQSGTIFETGRKIKGAAVLKIDVLSTKEFGSIQTVRLYSGIIGSLRENVLKEWHFTGDTLSSELTIDVEPSELTYVRAEVYTDKKRDSGMIFAATNPIWMDI